MRFCAAPQCRTFERAGLCWHHAPYGGLQIYSGLQAEHLPGIDLYLLRQHGCSVALLAQSRHAPWTLMNEALVSQKESHPPSLAGSLEDSVDSFRMCA